MKRTCAIRLILLSFVLLLGLIGCTKDTTPPVLSDISASNASPSSFTITWATNEPSTSQVKYGLDTSYGSATADNTALVTAHSVTLKQLHTGATYHYKLKSTDASGNQATSIDHIFDTPWIGPNGETLHETVTFEGAIVTAADGHDIALDNNPKATDVTWAALKQFLLNDQTNAIPYSDNTFVCADFAERLHNNAEQAGIRAAYVSIDFGYDPRGCVYNTGTGCEVCPGLHASNAFMTTDRGLVYIDDTGTTHGTGGDTTVSISVGSIYQPESIFSTTQWCEMGTVQNFSVTW